MVSNLGRVLDRSLRQSKIQGKREGLSQGKQEGLLQGKVESIFELLGEISEVPEDLIVLINEQKDTGLLNKWLIIAAKSKTIEEFRSKIKT
jgi:hypothetical protein